jgi:hypothetical protein
VTHPTVNDAALWDKVAKAVQGVQSAGPPAPAPTSELQATLRAVLAMFGDEATDPCGRADCGHPYASHAGRCMVQVREERPCRCRSYINGDDMQVAGLAGDISAVLDERGDSYPWTGSAALLAYRVRKLISQPIAPMSASEASDKSLVRLYERQD